MWTGAPWKTQERVRQVLDTLYDDTPEGLAGNEDCGQMSAWYVMSAIGLYPANPAGAFYVVGSPLFRRVTLDLGEGKKLVVRAENASPANRYVQSATLGGKPLARAWVGHDELVAAGDVAFVMGPQPNKSWGAADGGPAAIDDCPRALSTLRSDQVFSRRTNMRRLSLALALIPVAAGTALAQTTYKGHGADSVPKEVLASGRGV